MQDFLPVVSKNKEIIKYPLPPSLEVPSGSLFGSWSCSTGSGLRFLNFSLSVVLANFFAVLEFAAWKIIIIKLKIAIKIENYK